MFAKCRTEVDFPCTGLPKDQWHPSFKILLPFFFKFRIEDVIVNIIIFIIFIIFFIFLIFLIVVVARKRERKKERKKESETDRLGEERRGEERTGMSECERKDGREQGSAPMSMNPALSEVIQAWKPSDPAFAQWITQCAQLDLENVVDVGATMRLNLGVGATS